MKLSLLTTLALSWLYGTVAGLLLPHGPLALVLYGLLLLALTGAAHVTHRALIYQLALADFRRDLRTARRLAAHASGGYYHAAR
jgi:inner membrane protein involved in colicin E2 resistance